MNILQAKEQIRQTVEAYREKNAYGEPVIPLERQRPIFLMGAPGIGKTAILAQVAQELEIGLVSYTMTHHTRQSALGLPYIVHKTYGGQPFEISEYTMSEIIASVYERIEGDGMKEGILFLDELNCVSETLAPSILQFLQYKTFGQHRVPQGWVIVTAGNPPEYNDSVREFDMATWDRVKRIDVEPDYEVWKAYAAAAGIHPAVLTYLDLHREDFYSVEADVGGKRFVTARGWTDLSDMMGLYERKGFAIDEDLVRQYLQEPRIARSFAVYCGLFSKYRSSYPVDIVLAGKASPELEALARRAAFDERLALLELLIDALREEFREAAVSESAMTILAGQIARLRVALTRADAAGCAALLQGAADELEAGTQTARRAGAMSDSAFCANRLAARILGEMAEELSRAGAGAGSARDALRLIQAHHGKENARVSAATAETGKKLGHLFRFCEKVFPDGQELLILVTELTSNPDAASFIGRHGCDAYFRHNGSLLFSGRRAAILQRIDALEGSD